MSIDRVNRSSFINAYNLNSKRIVNNSNKIKECDTIEISSLGKSLTDYSYSNNIDGKKKIVEIKSKVDSGTYSIDARLTARSILDFMRESKI